MVEEDHILKARCNTDKRDKIGVQIYILRMYIYGFFSLGHEVMKKKIKNSTKHISEALRWGRKSLITPFHATISRPIKPIHVKSIEKVLKSLSEPFSHVRTLRELMSY